MSEFELALERTTFRPGDEVVGEVRWDGPRVPDGGALRLRWTVTGKGDTESEVVGEVPLRELPRPPDASAASGHPYRSDTTAADEAPPLAARDRRAFRFRLPDRPWSVSGRLLTITWVVTASLDALDRRVEIIVSPSGKEVAL